MLRPTYLRVSSKISKTDSVSQLKRNCSTSPAVGGLNFELNEDQKAFRDLARTFAREK
jgi:hypothetical protein